MYILATNCDDYIIVAIFTVLNRIINLLHIIAPILLIVMATVQLTKLVNNPEDPKGVKSIINKFLAAGIIFFLPVIINIVLGILPDSVDVIKCMKTISEKDNSTIFADHDSIEIKDTKRKELAVDKSLYDIDDGSSSSAGSAGQGSEEGKEIANYALKFVGEQYVLGGQWDGEEPYSPTDCSGFVQGIYRHFGYDIPRTTDAQDEYLSANAQRIPEDQVQAGDIVLFIGHVGIATGNGYQMVHASDDDVGVIVTDDFRYRERSGVFRLAS